MGRDHRDVVTKEQGTQHRMILRYEHDQGSYDDYCLARLVVRETLPPVAVFTEIRQPGNTHYLGSFGRLADALRDLIDDSVGIDWDQVLWVKHYGEFSAYYIEGHPEKFAVGDLVYFNGHYHGDLDESKIHYAQDFFAQYGDLGLDPVPETVEALGRKF